MRLIRSVCPPANIGLSLRFRRCQDTKISSACLHPVLNDTSNRGNGSNILGCHRSYAAAAVSSALEDRKPCKRLSKNERKTMVETYVNEYRITNEGKFPSISDTKKQVGGGYYFVRQIIQEMIYNSKQSSTDAKYTYIGKSSTKKIEIAYNSMKPIAIKDSCLEESASEERSTDTMDTSLEKSTMKEDEISIKFEEVPQTKELGEDTRPILKDIKNSSSMISKSKQDQQFSVSVETNEPKDVGAQSHHPNDKPESSRDLDYEKECEILEDKVKSDALEHKAGSLESTEVSGRGLHEVPPRYAESQNKSSVWNNLKSFANGILSMWKRS